MRLPDEVVSPEPALPLQPAPHKAHPQHRHAWSPPAPEALNESQHTPLRRCSANACASRIPGSCANHSLPLTSTLTTTRGRGTIEPRSAAMAMATATTRYRSTRRLSQPARGPRPARRIGRRFFSVRHRLCLQAPLVRPASSPDRRRSNTCTATHR